MHNKIRSKVVKESLLDYNTLANSLKENTESAVKTLLDEAVRDTYAKLLSEDDDKDYEESEVEDTTSSDIDDADDANEIDGADDAADDAEMDSTPSDDDSVDDDASDDTAETSITDVEDDQTEGEDDGDEEWGEFDKYKVSDDEYDFTNAEDEEIVKVYKLMKNDDQILVHKDDDGKVGIKDNETGAEYILDLGGDDATDDGLDGMDDFGGNNDEDMNESTERLFELVLEYDSNVGYTDNYQKKDVMTSDGVSEPGKGVRDWDKGIPHGSSKPWSGYPKKKADKPFNAEKGKQVEEEDDSMLDMSADGGEINELKTNAEHAANNGSTSRTDGPNNPRRRKARNFHTAQNGQETSTSDNAYTRANESFLRKANKVLSENKELKGTLTNVMTSLKEAAVTNHNLAQIIKLISENSTTQDEKREIISKFAKQAKTIDESKRLYESLSDDLKKNRKMNITESNGSLSVEGSKKINETTIYKSQDVIDSLDLMHRMMK